MMTPPLGLAFVVLMGLTLSAPATAQPAAPFPFAGREVPPGTRAEIDLPVPAGATDGATFIPVTVFHGARSGPVLAIAAGIHGYEFPPILAAQQLLAAIDPGRLGGTVLLVRVAHVEAFLHRSPFVNPWDRKNLARVFPGRADGTQSERIAWALTTSVLRRADLFVDLHAGDGAEWLEPFVGVYGGALAVRQFPRAKTMGLAFGVRNIVIYRMDTPEQIEGRGRSATRQAVADGKPTVLVEMGENGRRDQTFVDAIVAGALDLLMTLGMIEGTPRPVRHDWRWFDGVDSVTAASTGIFTPIATAGRLVSKGERIGTITDFSGAQIEDVRSPVDGYALYGLTGPPVRAGDTVVTIGRPSTPPQ